MKQLMKSNNYADFPCLLCPKEATQRAFTLDVVLKPLPAEEGPPRKWMILKWYQFIDTVPSPELLEKIYPRESVFPICAHADPFSTNKVIGDLLEKLGGYQRSH